MVMEIEDQYTLSIGMITKMHTIVELANAARRAKTTVMDTLRAEGIEFIEKIGSQGGRPLKLYKITIQEFIKLQEARTPGKKPKPKVEQQQVNGINDLLLARWSR